VTVKQQLTALHVTVKVSKCSGLANTGSFDTVGSTFTVTATKDSDGSITYEFDLAKGDTIAPGTYTFAAQFQHASSGWKPQDDTFYVSARTATSKSASSASGAY
jgi:prolyl oligopeptidase PreP (S9A serine peptidase family)